MKDIPSRPDDYNIYCTGADSSVHSFLQTGEPALLRSIKLCALLSEHVYVSCSHIYENLHTRRLLTNHPDLLATGLVAVGLRSDCRDFHDLAELRSREGRRTSPDDVALTQFLDKHAPYVIRWTPMEMQPQFKSSILEMLEDPSSLLRRRLTATSRSATSELRGRIAALSDEDANRTTMHRLAAQLIPQRTRAFMREVNLLYYVLGSVDKNLRPHLSPLLFTDLDRGCEASTPRVQEAPLDDWLVDMLHQTSFPVQLLDRLSVGQIARIREDARGEVRRFRDKWWKIVGGRAGQTWCAAKDNVVERLAEAVARENKRSTIYDEARRRVELVSLLLSFAGLLPHPAIAALSALVSILAYTASASSVKRRVLGTDFAALTTTIISRATE